MVSEKMYDKLALLAIKKGVNLQKGQPLVIRANLRDKDFIKKIVKIAYENGAKSVSIDWRDEDLSRWNYEYKSIETLSEVPDWMHDKTKWEQDSKACYLSVASDMPGALKDVDSDKLNAYQQAYYGKMADLMAYTMNNEGQWCILGVPSVEWARVVFPDLSDEEAFEKLGDAIFAVTRVSEDNDPIAEWEAHDKELMEHARKLNEYNFKELHFTSASGTDLTVGLVKDHIWAGGCGKTPEGIYFDPNMPTEEVFCMPLKTGTNGKVVASKPLSYNGKVIEDFWFRFENGKVVDFDATMKMPPAIWLWADRIRRISRAAKRCLRKNCWPMGQTIPSSMKTSCSVRQIWTSTALRKTAALFRSSARAISSSDHEALCAFDGLNCGDPLGKQRHLCQTAGGLRFLQHRTDLDPSGHRRDNGGRSGLSFR